MGLHAVWGGFFFCGLGMMENGDLTPWCQLCKCLQLWASVQNLALLEELVSQMVQPQQAVGKACIYKPAVQYPAEIDVRLPFKFPVIFSTSSEFA